MIKEIKRFFERGRKGYCYEDLWQFDNWLSNTIARGLKEFKSNCHSYPSEAVTWEQWMAILDEMIECFEEQVRGDDNIPVKSDGKTLDFDVWDKRRAHKREKLKRGLEILGKYYYDLWD